MSAEKHSSYFNLLEALTRAEGCPLCFLETRVVHSYLDAVLHESVNDPSVRAALEQSRGYCRAHAEKLLAFRDGLGTAILYQEVLRDWETFLVRRAGRTRKLSRAQARAWLEHAGCPACRAQQEARARYIATLLGGVDQDEMKSALEAGPGLCVPHLLSVLEATSDQAVRRYLVETHQSKCAALLRELKEFCRKQDYRQRGEGFGKEGDSWLRAVRMIAGGRSTSA